MSLFHFLPTIIIYNNIRFCRQGIQSDYIIFFIPYYYEPVPFPSYYHLHLDWYMKFKLKKKCSNYFRSITFNELKLNWNVCTVLIITSFEWTEPNNILVSMGNDHLIEFQLIEIVFYHLIKIMLITWSNFLTLFTWSNYLINWFKRTDRFWQLIEILKSLKYHY